MEVVQFILTTFMEKTLGGFYHQLGRWITGKLHRKISDGSWHYPLLADAMRTVGLEELETYISWKHNTVAQYTATRPILDL